MNEICIVLSFKALEIYCVNDTTIQVYNKKFYFCQAYQAPLENAYSTNTFFFIDVI